MDDKRRTYEDVLKDRGWLYYHSFSLPMTADELDFKLLISSYRAIEQQLTTAKARIAELEAGRHADRVALVEFMVDKAKDIADGILETDAEGIIKAFEERQADAAARDYRVSEMRDNP